MTEENHEKSPVRLVGTGIRTWDLPNASLVRYHGATSLGDKNVVQIMSINVRISTKDQLRKENSKLSQQVGLILKSAK